VISVRSNQKGNEGELVAELEYDSGVYFAYFAMGGEAVESCPFSPNLAHHVVLEQGIIIIDRITGYALFRLL
jgi:hypothetical protein